jgi:hypothetical protein
MASFSSKKNVVVRSVAVVETDQFNQVDRGHIVLSYGQHEVAVKTAFNPSDVFVSCCDKGCPVCWGTLTLATAVKTSDGFILCADVQSASCTVQWIAES